MLDRVFGLRARGTTVRREAAAGRFREVKPGAIALALICLSYYVLGLPH